MANYDIISGYDDEELFNDRKNVTDLHAYYMTQFNLELENSKTKKDSFKYGVEESFNFEVLDSWTDNGNNGTDFGMIDEALNTNIDEQNIKEVLLDLDSIDFEEKSYETDSFNKEKVNNNFYGNTNEYIDDESLIDELCREDEPKTPEGFKDYALPNTENMLPSIETVFSKRLTYSNEENYFNNVNTVEAPVSSIDHYSYPNNILYNLDNNNKYILPDTPTSCTEFNFERNERKISVCESIESDIQSSTYYDENSETFDEDELFINLDDFGIHIEKEGETQIVIEKNNQRKLEKEKSQGDRVCLWEQCYEKYPNQSTLVEHIERAHVNTYKGDEFSCLWRDCARARRPFNARYKLLIHMRVHSGHKPNRCHHPGCGKAFSRLENLKIHVRSHTGERPYACPAPHCRKAFSNSSDRAKHQRTHFNARPYACGAAGCGKRYTDPSSLRKHVKSHPHMTSVPRTCIPPSRPIRREEQTVPSSPAKLATLRCIRDKLTVPKLHRL